MKLFFRYKYSILTALVFTGLFLSSCQKQKDSIVKITVHDVNGQPVSGVNINLSGQPSDSVYVNRITLYDLDEVTNDEGVATFTFTDFYDQGDNGFAILTIEATKDSSSVTDYVKVAEEQTIEKIVVLP